MKSFFKNKPVCNFYKNKKGIFLNCDCISKNGMPNIKKHSIDLILCDLPYGITDIKWDKKINTKKLWKFYKRILKPKGTIILTASQPFTTELINGNSKWFKYEIIWAKNYSTGFAHAKNKPMRRHENILIFSPATTVHKTQSKNRMTYNPQGIRKINIIKKNQGKKGRNTTTCTHKNAFKGVDNYKQEFTNYPQSILYFNKEIGTKHKTQKPIKLWKYLINTYSNEGDMVLDNTAGYGTTAVACMQTKRKYICIELSKKWFRKSIKRIKKELGTKREWWK